MRTPRESENDTAGFIEVETPLDKAEVILERLRLENCESVEQVEEQSQLVDYWSDEILENAMNEVPVFIVFCTKIQHNNDMYEFDNKSILSDSDKEGQVKAAVIEMIN